MSDGGIEQIEGGLELLLAAIHADDPRRELLVRVGDLMRAAKSAAARIEALELALGAFIAHDTDDPDMNYNGSVYCWMPKKTFEHARILLASRPTPTAGEDRRWRHKKRGSIVTEIARGFAQVSHHPIEEMTAVVIYRHDKDGRYWVRNAVEFDDGRFEALASLPAQDTPGEGAVDIHQCGDGIDK